MQSLWEEIELVEGWFTRTAFVRSGLMIVYALDEDFGSWPNHFEIWHRTSGEYVLSVDTSLERTMEIAEDLCDVADWVAMSSVDDLLIQARILAFGAGYPDEVVVFENDWVSPDIDALIPYGAHH